MRRSVVDILLLAFLLLMASCSVHKNTARSRFWQSFTARYNTFYNGKLAFIDGSLDKEKGNKDDYTEMLPLFTVANKQSRSLGSGNFDRTIEKMEKTIKQHSIKARPEWKKNRRKTAKDIEWLSRREYNPFLWKAWLMLGQAQFQKGAFDEAAATFSYMSRLYQTQPAINGVARAWLARCYSHLDWLYDAEDVIRNQHRDSIHYLAQPAWNQTLTDYYLRTGNLEQVVPLLRKVIKREHRKTQKAREWFIMGQVLASLGRTQESYKAYSRVAAQNPPYELEFNARIAQTEVMGASNFKKMISRLKRMAASDNNKDYLDQVYYAIGNIYLTQNDTAKAIAAYEQGNQKSTRNGIEKGVLLLKLGNIYWQMERFNDAQRCYGEAIGQLDKERPDYAELSKRSKVLDELVPFTDAIHLQDSLQVLAALPEDKRLEAIDRVIEELKKKEKEEADKAREAEVEQALNRQGAQGNRNRQNQRNNQQSNTQMSRDGQWYFYSQMAVNQGKQTFQRQWGKRENADNWQRVNVTVVGAVEPMAEDSLLAKDGGNLPLDSIAAPTEGTGETGSNAEADSLANDPHNREYYLAQIPFTEEQVEASNEIIKDGLYNAGVIFKDKLENLPLAEKQLARLSTQYPDYAQMDQAWYHLFLLYSRQGRVSEADSCLARMKAYFPESDWTILLSNPYFVENARFGVHIEDSLYAATYEAFRADQHDVIAANTQLSSERFPLGDNRPKFLFVHGLSLLNQGDAKGCVDELKQVVEKYPQSEVTEMAGMIVKGVQEGRTLYGGKFDLDDIWNRRDLTIEQDSASVDTLSADRDVPFVFLLAYQPDSLAAGLNVSTVQAENQLLYEMARFNFSNFLVRNFDLEIERETGYSRMLIRGFLNFDEALQYARQLMAAESLSLILGSCRSLVISEHNLTLIGARYSYKDYDEFYEKTLLPLPISDEELLQMPDYELPMEEDDEDTPEEGEPQQQDNGGFDFGDDFFF
ncbi:MAG: tetratricopeptide repeat protein [Prevotella sp.]|nr:tetratricopeptide repeat protein [Prevotella sp.]